MKISPQYYIHPEDKSAHENLKSIPLFSSFVKAYLKIFSEQLLHGLNMGHKIRLGPNQLPKIYNYLPPICEKLGINEPEFYLEMSPSPNAYTNGNTKAFITITSGAIEYMDEDEIIALLAHECGHIACEHVLYHTMATMLMQFGTNIFGPLAAAAEPFKLALLYWYRRSELSADRAAAVVTGGSNSIIECNIRWAGGPKSITGNIDIDLYARQAEDYRKLIDESKWHNILQNIAVMNNTHPFNSVRVREILNWCRTEEFQRILTYQNDQENSINCPSCNSPINSDWKFCKSCGSPLNN